MKRQPMIQIVHRSAIAAAVAAAMFAARGAIAAGGRDASGAMQTTTSKTLETYVPTNQMRVAAIELRAEAIVATGDVTLKQVCRWSDADAEIFQPVADLIVVRLKPGQAFETLSIEQVQSLVRDAGINPGSLNFAGAGSCTVSRSDVKVDEAEALRGWVTDAEKREALVGGVNDKTQSEIIAEQVLQQQARMEGKGDGVPQRVAPASGAKPGAAEPAGNLAATPTAQSVVTAAPAATGDLRARLISDVATRLQLPVEKLQVDFKPEDRKLLSLGAPFEFTIEPQRTGDLGETSWIVTVSSGGESAASKRVRITANARAWMEQVVTARPLTLRQTIGEGDVEVRRTLADRLPTDTLVSKPQLIGQQAARDLKAGTVLTAKMLAPVELIRANQLVTVHIRRGAIEIKSVARALQNGSAGQVVKVKNETTNQVYQVTIIGPQLAVLSTSDRIASTAE